MRNPPICRIKQDRRDPVARASRSQCPSCGATETTLLTRTIAAAYLGCDVCGHLWNVPKRGEEPLEPPAIEFMLADD